MPGIMQEYIFQAAAFRMLMDQFVWLSLQYQFTLIDDRHFGAKRLRFFQEVGGIQDTYSLPVIIAEELEYHAA